MHILDIYSVYHAVHSLLMGNFQANFDVGRASYLEHISFSYFLLYVILYIEVDF